MNCARPTSPRRALTAASFLLTAIAGLLLGAGCNSEKSPPAVSTDSGGSRTESSGKGGGAKVSVHEQSVDGIPFDVWKEVWLSDPYTESQNVGNVTTTPAPEVATAKSTTPAAQTAPEPAAADAAAGGGDDWKSIISAEALENEVKQIRLSINATLQGGVGKYNGAYKELQVDASVLAALAGVAIAHPDPVKWKDNAKYIRDLASEMETKASGLGAKPFEETQQVFDKLDQLLTGNMPADLAEAASEIDFSEVAKRSGLMKRMERAFTWMKSNINNEDSFKKESEKLASESALLAMLAKVAGTEGYASADEEEYQEFVKRMIQANRDVVAASQEGAFNKFLDANSRSQKACDECHVAYRFAEDI